MVKKNGQNYVKKLSKRCQSCQKIVNNCQKLSKIGQKVVQKLSKKLSKSCRIIVKKLSKCCHKVQKVVKICEIIIGQVEAEND
jgi:recombinational DNA repair protein RecR